MNARNTAFADQYAAAARDARALIYTCAASLRTGAVLTPPQVAIWLAQAVSEAARQGDLLACPHLGPSPSPALGLWTAHGVGRVGCAACLAQATAAIRDTAADRSCDRCDYTVTPGEPWSRLLVASGPITWAVGLCTACSLDLDLAPGGAA